MKKYNGFTLIELMVVIGLIGVISALAFPSYDSYMKKSRRADAKITLAKVADKQERYYLRNNIYAADTATLGLANPLPSDDGFYDITVTAGNINSFSLQAVPAAGSPQAGDDTTNHGDCKTLTIDSLGAKTPPACW